eukprot:2224921-Rhodomonas_salina.2
MIGTRVSPGPRFEMFSVRVFIFGPDPASVPLRFEVQRNLGWGSLGTRSALASGCDLRAMPENLLGTRFEGLGYPQLWQSVTLTRPSHARA